MTRLHQHNYVRRTNLVPGIILISSCHRHTSNAFFSLMVSVCFCVDGRNHPRLTPRLGTPSPRQGSCQTESCERFGFSTYFLARYMPWEMVYQTACSKISFMITTLAMLLSLVTKSIGVGYLPWSPRPIDIKVSYTSCTAQGYT